MNDLDDLQRRDCRERDSVRNAHPKADMAGRESQEQFSVLIADEEAPGKGSAREILAGSGFDSLWAGNGLEVLDLLRSKPSIRTLIASINLPDVDGLLLASLAQALNPSLKIVLVTADAEEARRLLALNQWPVWIKPFHLEHLPALATELCAH